MSSKPYRVGQWIPSDQKVIDKWLANLITEVKSKSKDKLALLMALHPPAEDEETARGENQLTVAEGRPRSPSACSRIIKSYHLRPRVKHVLPSDVLATEQFR